MGWLEDLAPPFIMPGVHLGKDLGVLPNGAANTNSSDPYGVAQGKSLFGLIGKGGLYDQGFNNLLDILNNPGKTDDALFNQSLAASGRNTGAALDANRARFARSGLGNSGLAMALDNAIRASGANREAGIRATEARRREDLRRSDLSTFLKGFVLDPNLARYANDRGIGAAQDAAKSQEKAATVGAVGSLIGALAAAFCWTADELYGKGSEEAALSRWYMVMHADRDTLDAYKSGGRDLAQRIKVNPRLRAQAKRVFDSFVARAREDFQ